MGGDKSESDSKVLHLNCKDMQFKDNGVNREKNKGGGKEVGLSHFGFEMQTGQMSSDRYRNT